MGCSGNNEAASLSLWGVVPDNKQPTLQQDGECTEGYMARAEAPDEKAGLATTEPDPQAKPKIANVSLVAKDDLSISQQMKSTKPLPGQTWKFLNPDNTPVSISGVTMSTAGAITGTFPAEGKYKIVVTLLDEGVEVDSKPFTIVVAKFVPGQNIKFVSPLPGGHINSPFGMRVHPIKHTPKKHDGVDMVLDNKQVGNVVAAADGEVLSASMAGGYGNRIIIGHANSADKKMATTHYCHLASFAVSKGAKVSAGDVIGREGRTGGSTGNHLHFEIRTAGGVPIDPAEYLSGKITISSKAAVDADGVPDPSIIASDSVITTKNNSGVSLSPAKVDNKCSGYQTDPSTTPSPTSDPVAKAEDLQKPVPTSPGGCKPVPYTPPTKQEVINRIQAVLDADGGLDDEDKKLIQFIAKIESRYDPYAANRTAKNPNGSSALGLFQFLDGLANAYFPKIGLAATCENRCDIEKATKAMIAFYKSELLPYYNNCKASGFTKLAGKTIVQTNHSARYSSLAKGCFIYGILHHDGVGNGVKGVDKQGVEYYLKKLNE